MEALDRIQMPANAYFFFLKSLTCEEALLRPSHTVTNANVAEEYIAVRDMWCAQGWAAMDLDGLVLAQELGQLVYPLQRRRSLLRWERDGGWECFVRGPVGLTWAVQEGEQVTLALQPGAFATRRLWEELSQRPRGMVEALRTSDGETARAVLDGLSPGAEELDEQMERLMSLFYREAAYA